MLTHALETIKYISRNYPNGEITFPELIEILEAYDKKEDRKPCEALDIVLEPEKSLDYILESGISFYNNYHLGANINLMTVSKAELVRIILNILRRAGRIK